MVLTSLFPVFTLNYQVLDTLLSAVWNFLDLILML